MSDPSGKYCGLELVGEPLAVGFFSVPFSQDSALPFHPLPHYQRC